MLRNLFGLISRKIGNTTDFWGKENESTILGFGSASYQHIHNPAKVYPTLANGIIVAGGVGAWTLGNFVEVIPANTITTDFDIHWVHVESVSATDIYELVLYSGLSENEVEIGRVRTSRESAQSGATDVPIQIAPQHANTRISAKLASKSGNNNMTISFYYHEYN